MPVKRPVGALSLQAGPETPSAFDANRAVTRQTRQTRIENRTHLDAPVSAAHFAVRAAHPERREMRPFVPGEGNLDGEEVP